MRLAGVASLIGSLLLLACGSSAESSGNPASGGGGTGGVGGTGGTAATSGTGGTGLGGAGTGGSGTGGGGTGATGGTATGGSGGIACVPQPACDAPLPDPGPARPWKHTTSSVISATGFDNHRGRDLVLTASMDQWVLGKFAYGVIDKDIHDEEVDIWLDRNCSGNWEKLGTSLTTNDGDHATVEGVDDTGGRIYYQIPPAQRLGEGRHRIWMVVAGDLTSAVQYIEVVPQGTHYFVTDVDGTLTTSETEEYQAILTGSVSPANPDASKALMELSLAGYRPFYLTARPEFLVGRTREFVDMHGFPLGVVHTTLTLTGATGASASTFKLAELNDFHGRGMITDYAFGNTASDAEAFFMSSINPADHRIFFQYSDTVYGGRRIDAYADLLAEFAALPQVCY